MHSFDSRVRAACLALLAGLVVLITAPCRASEALPAFKVGLVHDAALNAAIAAGDSAISSKRFAQGMQEYRTASADPDQKVRASALNRIGELYESGLGVAQDRIEALKWFAQSAALGNPYGEGNLANCLFFGLGTERDLEHALPWATKSGDQGVTMAMNQAGWQYLYAMGVAQDFQQARRWYSKSAELGDSLGQLQLGWMYVHVPPIDYAQAMDWYRKSAEQHDSTAQNNIGFLYENGLGVSRDYHEAARWYQLAADAGNYRALFHLGHLYDEGLGVPADKAKATRLMQQAADAGSDEAAQWLSTQRSLWDRLLTILL